MGEDGVVLVRLLPGEDFYEGLEKACVKHGVETGVLLSGIGQLVDFRLGYFVSKGDYGEKHFPDVHELIGLQGNVVLQDSEYIFHVHCVVGDRNKKAFGGHLLGGTVSITNEIALLKTKIKALRRVNEDTGLKDLCFD